MKTVVLTMIHLLYIQMQKCCMFGSNNIIKRAAQGCAPSKLLPQRPAGMKQEGRASLIESSSAAQLQSLLPECLYLKGLPEESSHLARYSDSSQITAAGGFEYFAVSENKLHWVGLSWQLGWVCGFKVKRRKDEKSLCTLAK